MKTLKLHRAIAVGSIKITELSFREHTIAADYLAFDKPGINQQQIALIAAMSGQDEELIARQLSGVDYRRAGEEIEKIMALEAEALAQEFSQASEEAPKG